MVITVLFLVSCEQSQQPNPSRKKQVYDSVYVYDIQDTLHPQLLSKYFYQYDAAGNQIEAIEGTNKFTRSYDTKGNLLENTKYGKGHLEGNNWVAMEKYNYVYNAQSQTIQEEIYLAKGENQWQITYLSENTYSDDGMTRYVKRMRFMYDPYNVLQDTIWYKSVVKVNTNGDPVEICDSMQNVTTGIWNFWNRQDYVYRYDSQGNITYYRKDMTDDISHMVEENTYTYEYDQDGYITARNVTYRSWEIIEGMSGSSETSYSRRYVYYNSIK